MAESAVPDVLAPGLRVVFSKARPPPGTLVDSTKSDGHMYGGVSIPNILSLLAFYDPPTNVAPGAGCSQISPTQGSR